MLAAPLLRLAARTGTLLLGYLVLERWLLSLARLPEASYFRPVIAVELARRFLVEPELTPSYLLRMGVLAALVALMATRAPPLRARWSAIEGGAILRVLVLVPALLLAWAFATYEANLYFGQSHLPDRLALVALAALVAWRPAFVLPFVALAVAVAWQFNHPIGGYSVAEPFLLVRWLLLFCAFFIARALGTPHRSADFVFLALTLLAASYLVAGIGKIRMEWFARGDVALLLPATYANGWLGFLEPDTIAAASRRLARLDWALVAATLVVECGAAASLLHRKALVFFLLAWPAFHLGVFALSGILFWKWMALEVLLLVVLLKRPGAPPLHVFSGRHALLSIPLVVGGTAWFQPVDLTWYNAAVSYVYRFEAVGESGRRYSLPPAFFAPYDYQFTLGAFAYASPHRQLDVVWGATADPELAGAMAEAARAEGVEALERELGQLFLDERRARRLDAFLQRFVAGYNRRGSKQTLLSPLAPPRHLWTFRRPDAFDGSERIVRVVVSQVASQFDGSRYRESAPRHIRTVRTARIPGQ